MMPDILFELIMSWVFVAAVVLGMITVMLGFRQRTLTAKLAHFGVGAFLPFAAMAGMWMGTEG